MNSNLFFIQHHDNRKKRGVAIVIVLGFIVLLTGLVVAFFTRATISQQLSSGSLNQTKVNLLTQSAVDIIIGDLKEEIRAGSTPPLVQPNGQNLYIPSTEANRIPQRDPVNTDIPNLIKISRYASGTGQIPAPALPSNASNAPTTTVSTNGRSVTAQKWNAHYLLPLIDPSTPAATIDDTILDSTPFSGFVAPDWVYVTSNNGPTVLTEPNANVVGRYAYAVYDQGGLIDINLAGYPTGTPGNYIGTKSALSFVDLTHLGIPQAHVDRIVGWRNNISADPDGTFGSYTFTTTGRTSYFQSITQNQNGHLLPYIYNGPAGDNPNPNQSDQKFPSRQAFLKFWKAIANNSTNGPFEQLSLQYLGTFSRDINQPSYRPVGRSEMDNNDGSNIAIDLESTINPSFLTVRWTPPPGGDGSTSTDLVREGSDGTTAKEGEALVKHRFPLMKLAWLTYLGPSAERNTSDVDMAALINTHGIDEDFLQEGTRANILRDFGLFWNESTLEWEYQHNDYIPNTYNGPIRRLEDLIGTSTPNPPREANFFELLKAAINVGAIAKGANNHGAVTLPGGPGVVYNVNIGARGSANTWEDYQYRRDIDVDRAIIQIGANIIDQFDVDGYPTAINFNAQLNGPQRIVGIENLPYIYRIRNSLVVADQPISVPQVTPSGSSAPNPVQYVAGNTYLTNTGAAAVLLQPEVWNPHSTLSSPGNPRPGIFRFRVDSASPTGAGYHSIRAIAMADIGGVSGVQPSSVYANNGPTGAQALFAYGSSGFAPHSITLNMTGSSPTVPPIEFTYSSSDYNEPFLLHRPAQGAVELDPDVNQPTVFTDLLGGSEEVGLLAATTPAGTDRYIGLFLGMVPLRWYVQDNNGDYWIVSARRVEPEVPGFSTGLTARLEYGRGAGTWVEYDLKAGPFVGPETLDWSTLTDNGILTGKETWTTVADPRTARFGMFGGTPGASPAASAPAAPISGTSQFATDRPGDGVGIGLYGVPGLPTVTGWPVTSPSLGTPFYPGAISQNNTLVPYNTHAYLDPDGVVRGAMGGFSGPSTASAGLPMQQTAASAVARPFILNRPFRSPAELGYVFSGTPWRNLDMSRSDSGFDALLDIFCINPIDRDQAINEKGLVAGKININTRQSKIIEAVLLRTYVDEFQTLPTEITSTLAETMADAITTHTSTTPLENISELVTSLESVIQSGLPSSGDERLVPRLREATIRALSSLSTARVWNLMIDVIAQTGRFSLNQTSLSAFEVASEQRYWVHIAIDRYTGEVLDRQVEVVK